ncbi:MAG: PAS domain-containing sensor histidine kinase [Planctomycetes bacterium]|nr:PAS domain-containing sensor histidine kinase [Planctomycetota bacterium]
MREDALPRLARLAARALAAPAGLALLTLPGRAEEEASVGLTGADLEAARALAREALVAETSFARSDAPALAAAALPGGAGAVVALDPGPRAWGPDDAAALADVAATAAALCARADEADQRYRMALRGSPVVLFEQDLDLRITWFENPPPGFDAARVLGKTEADLFSRPDEAAHVTEVKRRVMTTGRSERMEVTVCLDGVEREYDLVVDPRRGPDRRVIGVICAAVDVTDHRRAQRRLQILADAGLRLAAPLALEDRLRGLARLVVPRVADGCVVSLTTDGGGLETLEVAAAADDARRALEAFVAEAGAVALLERAVAGGEAVRVADPAVGDLHGPDVAARLRPRSLVIAPMAARGRTLGALTFVHTARSGRLFDEDDLALARALALRAALAIDNLRLLDEATQAVAARDEVVRIVGHDLRSPLQAIALTVQRLQALQATPPPDALALLLRTTLQMDRLVSDLLDVSTIEAGGLTVDPAATPPAALARASVEPLLPIAGAREVALDVDVPPDLPPVLADRERALQVLQNLLANAIRFTPARGRVAVRARRAADGVRFSVADAGPGVDPAHRPHLFDRFWQARRGRGAGAGLGLAIARGIVEAHGGRLVLEESSGPGAIFSFTLRAARP